MQAPLNKARRARRFLAQGALALHLTIATAMLMLAVWPVPAKYPWGIVIAAMPIGVTLVRDTRVWGLRGLGTSDRTLLVLACTTSLLAGWTLWHVCPMSGVRTDWIGDLFAVVAYALLIGFALVLYVFAMMSVRGFLNPRMRRWIDECDARARE